ncbi:PREDICTED: uncharacterized protein LOC108761811 [Trachymyrmex cornetzi]|uniref:uncharacterized protein LOC108761811 n=1 Tax=Trachymyrmex cornetzi TaxID=471704 RepID=UPI00084F47D9|nr:PREDICTED: uncharacterized protein LOC108761811 [Trachymyrmex cornetzi]
MAWLNKKEETKNNENMKVLEYVWLPGDDNKPNNSNKFVYENLPLSSLNNPNAVGIKISPRLFINDRITPSVTSIREKWFYNLSSVDIPTNIQYLLQLGENFALPISGGKPLVMEFIKSIENNIKKMQSSVHNNVRNHSVSLVSLDVVSLFTNVPLELAMEALSNRWGHIEKSCKIPKEKFLKTVQLILDSTYFTFDKQIYKQTFGTPMGSPLSPIIADMVMQDLESRVLSTIEFPVLFYYRVAHYSINKLNKCIRVHKDTLPIWEKRNVVYQIGCRDCDATYVGQTGRKLNTRVGEHRRLRSI